MAKILHLYVLIFTKFKGIYPFNWLCANIWEQESSVISNWDSTESHGTKMFKIGGLVKGFLWLLITINCLFVSAQSFPVQLIPQVSPPPPIYFTQYADASTTNSPLRLQIILNDLEISNREIRLKAYFQGNGISFQSNDVVVGASPLFLEGGIPLVLTNAELAPYFRYENITGISPNVYGQAIPEGAYQFCYEVYDVLTGNRLSQKSCAVSVVFQNEPPFLISPRNKTLVAENNPQNIIFQWTPRSINVSNVEYELSLVEIWDTQIDPQAAFLSSPPIFQTTTTSTTYVYGPADPLLLSGKNYAWRIQAKAKQGAEEIGLFKNHGYSEIFSFSYAGSCDLPFGINHEVKGSTNANIFWDDFTTDVPEYTIRYRQKGNTNEWFLSKTNTNQLTLWDLKAGTTYEYQLQKKCVVTGSDWSMAKQFTTFLADNEASVYQCGITPNFSLTNKEPLPKLSTGESFEAGDFPIHVLEVSGSNGRFTGKGYVTIPYLNNIKVGVEFTNVQINTDKQMSEGTVVTVYDPNLASILEVDEVVETVDTVSDLVSEPFEGDNDLDEIRINWSLDPKKDIKVVDGILIITNPANDATVSEPLGDDKVVIDKDKKVYHIDAGGNVTEGGNIDSGGAVTSNNVEGISTNGQLERLTAKDIQITFKEVPGDFSFDEIPNTTNASIKKVYTTILDADGNDYTLAHQAVENGQTAYVDAIIEQTGSNQYALDSIVFKTKQGEKIPVEIRGNNTIRLTLKGRYTFENEIIYAVVPSMTDRTKQLTAGAFTLWHMTDRPVDVVLVSVNGGNVNGLATEVAKIFKKGVATINIETQTARAELDLAVLGDNARLDIGDSGWLTNYNSEQKAVIADLKNKIDYNFNKYYVFVFGGDILPTKPIGGFMPLQRQFGFVFTSSENQNADEEGKGELAKTIAHEIGHGVFALQHPFDLYGKEIEGKTDWLMDYANGSLLSHMDWKQLHNPELKFYVFQDDEDGEIAGKIWFTPDWQTLKVENTNTIYIGDIHEKHVQGTVPGFNLDNKTYKAIYDENGSFKYYKSSSAGIFNFTPATILENEKVFLFQNNGECGKNKYFESTYKYVVDNKNNIDFADSDNLKNGKVIPCSLDLDKLCETGRSYFNQYNSTVDSESEKNYLFKASELICKVGSEELLEAQKAAYEEWKNRANSLAIALNQPFSFEDYFDALLELQDWREKGLSEILKAGYSEGNKELRNQLFDIAYKINTKVLSLIPLDQKIELLTVMMDGKLYNMFTKNHDALVVKVISSIKDSESSDFLEALLSSQYKNSDDKPLIYILKENLNDFLNSANPYAQFFGELKRLTDAKNRLSDGEPDIKVFLKWDVEQKDYVIFSIVKNRNDYDFVYDSSNHTVSVGTCKEYEYSYSSNINIENVQKTCKEYMFLLEEGSSPFDLVGLTILNDISPFGDPCLNGTGPSEFCGEVQIVPALFLDYLKTKENSQRLTNLGWNTFQVVITVATLGEGAVAISAVRAASNGQKLYVATKNAYALLDFTYSVADFGFKAADADMPDAWLYVGYAFAAKTSYDLINKGGAKGIGYLRKLLNEERSDEVLEIIEELDVSLKGKKLTTNDVEDFVQKAESKIKNADPEFNRQYEEGISGNFGDDWITYIGKGIDGVSSPPAGYQLYFRNGNKWIRRLDANNPSTPRLTVKEGKITEYTGNTISSFSSSQVNNIALAALNNASSNKVMLGKFDQGGISYITEAGTEYSYFYLDNWDDIYKLVNESGDEMWKVNAKFLENQFTANKTFYFSHNPYEATRSFKQEIDYLKNILEVKDFVKEGKYWKAIW
tara:strand:- start:2102 stop:7507 length:5406 start_codon:yes stop_codon:yes gene_type:complete